MCVAPFGADFSMTEFAGVRWHPGIKTHQFRAHAQALYYLQMVKDAINFLHNYVQVRQWMFFAIARRFCANDYLKHGMDEAVIASLRALRSSEHKVLFVLNFIAKRRHRN
jgi:hypothetical protein